MFIFKKIREITQRLNSLEKLVNELDKTTIKNNKELTVKVPYIDFGLDDKCKLPTRKKKGDCGYDAYALTDVTILPHTAKKVPLGIGLIIPEPFGVKAETRSGNHLDCLNIGSAWVDRGYRGQINALIQNVSNKAITIHKGDRPCSIELLLTFKMDLVPAKDYYSEEEYKEIMNTERGTTGFGSSRKII